MLQINETEILLFMNLRRAGYKILVKLKSSLFIYNFFFVGLNYYISQDKVIILPFILVKTLYFITHSLQLSDKFNAHFIIYILQLSDKFETLKKFPLSRFHVIILSNSNFGTPSNSNIEHLQTLKCHADNTRKHIPTGTVFPPKFGLLVKLNCTHIIDTRAPAAYVANSILEKDSRSYDPADIN